MRIPNLELPSLTSDLNLGLRRNSSTIVGLDIQPGFVAAVEARAIGTVVAERAAAVELEPDTVRDGEVVDDDTLSEVLRGLFKSSGLSRRVRVGIANQRTVLRTLELPPVTDAKELAAAVNFQAQEQVPMPLSNAVLDFHPLGIIDTPAGPRQRVVLVAAQRDMVERLLTALRAAGLEPQGIDLSAFALIRSLYRREPEAGEKPARVLYLNIDGLTNLAIAEGTVCRFTRVVGGGLEAMAAELAERRGISRERARALLPTVDLCEPAPVAQEVFDEPPPALPDAARAELLRLGAELDLPHTGEPSGPAGSEQAGAEQAGGEEARQEPAGQWQAGEQPAGQEQAGSFEPVDFSGDERADVWAVLEAGIRDIYGEVRNSLDFHRSQDGGGEVSYVVLSGAAQDIPGFAEALQSSLGLEVRSEQVPVHGSLPEKVSAHRLAVASGLAVQEVQA